MLCACAESAITYIALGDVDADHAAPEPSAPLTWALIALVYGAIAFAFVVGH
jgi:hypothetical protein